MGFKYVGMQYQERAKACEQAGIGAFRGNSAPQSPHHQWSGEGRHHAAVADPNNQRDIFVDKRPGHAHAHQQHHNCGHATNQQDAPIKNILGKLRLKLGDNGAAVQIVGNDL